ncbi:MAG: hypothetical protein ACLFTK_12790 [Anaerolineales bacterium]
MRRRLPLNVVSAIVASSMALITIILLLATGDGPQIIVGGILQLVIVTAAFAVLIGIFNLVSVHTRRITSRQSGWLYSGVVLLAAFAVLLLRALDVRTSDAEPALVSDVVFEAVQVSLESALAGLLFFFLVYAAYRFMRDRVSLSGCLFTFSVLIVLAGWIPLQGLDALQGVRDWLLRVPATAGINGLLIGIALGTITVGIRTLIGQERAYRE